MPAENDAKDTSKVDPNLKKKQILVAVLLVGLLIAIMTQPSQDSSPENQPVVEGNWVSASADAVFTQESQAALTQPSANSAGHFSQTSALSHLELDEIIQLELLAAPPRPRYQERTGAVQHVQAIYGTESQRSALLGQSIVRDGHALPDGGKVLRVRSNGVQVEQ